ncbi:MAG TPA: cyclic lactone autoinducer peptide [Bacillota bacterium]|nr:cyclic lactone autoinducer peptide [Bacillota bacterium]
MKRLGAYLVILLCTVFAMLSISSACVWSWHQPELPQKPQS